MALIRQSIASNLMIWFADSVIVTSNLMIHFDSRFVVVQSDDNWKISDDLTKKSDKITQKGFVFWKSDDIKLIGFIGTMNNRYYIYLRYIQYLLYITKANRILCAIIWCHYYWLRMLRRKSDKNIDDKKIGRGYLPIGFV